MTHSASAGATNFRGDSRVCGRSIFIWGQGKAMPGGGIRLAPAILNTLSDFFAGHSEVVSTDPRRIVIGPVCIFLLGGEVSHNNDKEHDRAQEGGGRALFRSRRIAGGPSGLLRKTSRTTRLIAYGELARPCNDLAGSTGAFYGLRRGALLVARKNAFREPR